MAQLVVMYKTPKDAGVISAFGLRLGVRAPAARALSGLER
jgi:hypothetical protein